MDGTHLYWSDVASGGGKIQKVALAGGSVTTLAEEFVEAGLAIDADNVYWGTSVALAGRQYVHRVAKTGGPVSELAEGVYPRDIVVSGTTLFFIGGNEVVSRVPVNGGAVESTQLGNPESLATDGADVFYGNNGAPGHVARVPEGGAAPVPLATTREPARLAVHGSTLYWLSLWDGTVNAVPKMGGPSSTLATIDGLRALSVDGAYVYVTAVSGPGMGSVIRIPVAGGNPTFLYSGPLAPSALANDARRIYWGRPGGIMALAK